MPKSSIIVPGAETVVAVYAHPDDSEVSCGGTLIRHVEAGAEVHIVSCTRGDKGSFDPDTSPDELAARRLIESEAAARVVGARKHHALNFDDGEIDVDDLRRQLVRLFRSIRPAVVIAPDPTAVFFGDSYINHRDHRRVGWAVLDAVAPDVASPLYQPEAGPSHRVPTLLLTGTLDPDAAVTVTDVLERKTAAVRCHLSQLTDHLDVVDEMVRERAAREGAPFSIGPAETFRRIRFV